VNLKKSLLHIAASLALGLALLPASTAEAQSADVVTVATVNGSAGSTVNVPVSIRDASGTPLGVDQPAGSRIQAFSIKVDYTNAAFIDSITFTRAGITQTLTPTLETSPAAGNSISLLLAFDETTNPIPFVSNAAAPGNQVGVLNVTLDPATPAGTVILLTLDGALTQLSNEGGTTTETTVQSNLVLINGSITVTAAAGPQQVPTLGEWALILTAALLAFVGLRRL
jgi:predicted secreted protein